MLHYGWVGMKEKGDHSFLQKFQALFTNFKVPFWDPLPQYFATPNYTKNIFASQSSWWLWTAEIQEFPDRPTSDSKNVKNQFSLQELLITSGYHVMNGLLFMCCGEAGWKPGRRSRGQTTTGALEHQLARLTPPSYPASATYHQQQQW